MVKLWPLILFAMCIGAVAPAAAAQQKQAADPGLERERAKSRQEVQRMLQDYPNLPPTPLAKVLQFHIVQNNLTLQTELQPTDGTSQIAVSDLAGLCTVDIHSYAQVKPPAGQPYTPMAMMFIRHDFDAPDCSESDITVQITPMNLQVSLDQETDSEIRQISLVEAGAMMRDDDPPVRLHVRVQSKNGDVPAVTINHAAADFVSLRRRYPADTARYLEPIFRALHADAVVFDADPRVAWQVFADAERPDPAVTKRVLQLLGQMDADDFRTREAASAELKRTGEPAAVALQHLGQANLSPEQSSRVESFLAMYHPVSDEQASRLGRDPNFLLDCLLDENDPFIVDAALNRLRAITGLAVPFDPGLHGEARQSAVYALRETVLAAPLREPGGAATAPAAAQVGTR